MVAFGQLFETQWPKGKRSKVSGINTVKERLCKNATNESASDGHLEIAVVSYDYFILRGNTIFNTNFNHLPNKGKSFPSGIWLLNCINNSFGYIYHL